MNQTNNKTDKPHENNLSIHFTLGKTTFRLLNFLNGRIEKPIPKHNHSSDSYEIHYISEGNGKIIVDGTAYTASANTLFITGPHVNHEQIPQGEHPMNEYCIYLEAVNTSLQRDTEDEVIAIEFLKKKFWIGQDKQNLLPSLKGMLEELQCQDIGFRTSVKTLFEQIIILLVRNYKQTPSHIQLKPHVFAPSRYLVIENSFLHDYTTLTLGILADRLNCSTRQTERLLKTCYNLTFDQMKLQARMSAAALLLSHTNTNITRISDAVGYSCVEHFCNAFKKYYGQSATDYRKAGINHT